jgi:hypothetical protein
VRRAFRRVSAPIRSGRLAEHLTGLSVRTVADMGWSGIKNGQSLNLAQSEFDVFVTVDRNLSFQQHLPKFSIAVLLLVAPSNRLTDLIPLVPSIIASLPSAIKGIVSKISLA